MSHFYINDDLVYSHIPSHEFIHNASLIRLIFVEIIQSLKMSTIPRTYVASEVLKLLIYNLSDNYDRIGIEQ